MSSGPELPVIYENPRFDQATPTLQPVINRAIRFGAILMLEWGTLTLIEGVPRYLKYATVVIAVLLLAVHESWPWLRMRSRYWYPSLMGILIVSYSAIFIYAELTLPPTSHSSPVSPIQQCWDGKAPPCSIASPIPPSGEPKSAEDLRWDQSLYIESAFLQLPKPCLVKLTGTKGNFNARNILRVILIRNSICEVADDQKDMSADYAPIDIDAPPPPKITGLVVRWKESFAPGETMFRMLNGEFKASKGHAMPPNSPENLIWIQVGDGYPWKK